ncbi:uncharacterized protein LOC129748367 isoform X2 [Uranotaenia lowii]|uniref:uncharacterized protein LOC129748367 isoform X2 n=1 Tax=Uranotaenia lowii TaxID=190385 RepID=UPI002479FC78|nr:uncharacterized protein LOC129748367 isoform X2 [Uranotaenia lowii]
MKNLPEGYILAVAHADPPFKPRINYLRSWCFKHSASANGYEKHLRNGYIPLEKCINQALDQEDLELEPTTENRMKQVQKYCPRSSEWMKCFDRPLEGIAMCLAGVDINRAKFLVNKVFGEIVKKLCENEAEYLVELVKPEYAQCLSELGQITFDCAIEPAHPSPLEISCANLDIVRSCFQQKISSCGAPTNGGDLALQTFLDPVYRINNCTYKASENQ